MSFLPTTAVLWRRCPQNAGPVYFWRRAHSYNRLVASPQSFEELGLSRAVVAALQEAIPNVQQPTQMQAEFLSSVMQGRDVLLKDATGTGKSFGLLLALLNQPRKYARVEVAGKYVKQPVISSLYIAPHRDLVLQFLHWIRTMYDATLHSADFQSIVQALLRTSSSTIAQQAERIHETPPHILLGTPQAILEAMQVGSISLRYLSTVIVDEADYLIEYLPKSVDKYDIEKFKRVLRKHPSPTRQILDCIYSAWQPPTIPEKESRTALPVCGPLRRRPQLIMTSATLKSAFRNTVLGSKGWFVSAHDRAAVVSPYKGQAPSTPTEDSVATVYGGSALIHSALVVFPQGDIKNIEGAVSAASDEKENAGQSPAASENELTTGEIPSTKSVAPIVTEEEEKDFVKTPSPFNPSALEAVAATFALHVPQVALLVLPATAPVQRAVFELRTLGVNAHGLDVVKSDSGGSFLLRKGAVAADNPTLLVSTLATTRGLDLPNLTHVFILGLPSSLTTDEYLHAAGRVGRFGRSGHVIAILEQAHKVGGGKGKVVMKDEPSALWRIYKKLDVTPVQIEAFDTVGAGTVGAGSPPAGRAATDSA